MNNLLKHLDENILPREGWFRTCVLSLGVGGRLLLCCRFYLQRKRPRCQNNISMYGKTCVITGANTGIGKAVALEFAKRKAHVILACRDIQKGNLAAVDIRKKTQNSNVEVYNLDLSSFASIRSFAKTLNEKEESLDVLVNNAGLMYAPFTKSEDGYELHFAVNHLGHFLLTNLLLNKMRRSSRIMVVSSSLYKKAQLDLVNFNKPEVYDPFLAYGKSKLATLLFVRELQHHLPEGVTANAMHPGIVWTELARYRVTNIFTKILYNVFAFFFLRTPDQGAQTIIHMATEPSLESVTNEYFGDCTIQQLLPHAKCDKMAEKLWEVSEQLTKQ